MSKFLRVLPRSAILAGLALPCGLALAQAPTSPPLTPEQSASLDHALRLWTSGGPDQWAGRSGYTVTPDGDHYRLEKKAAFRAGLAAARVQGGDLSASVRPLDGGRWQFDDIRAATPIVISAPSAAGKAGFQVTVDMQGQTGHVVIDPSLATPSTLDGAAGKVTATFNTPPASAGSFRMGSVTSHGYWRPAGPGRIDRSSAVAIGDLTVDISGKQAVSMSVGGFHGEARLKDLSPDRLDDTIAYLRDNMPGAAPAKAPPPVVNGKPASKTLTPAERQAMHAALDRARGIASAFATDGAMDDVAFVSGGHTVRFHQIGFAEGLSAPGGRFDATFRLTFDGLSSPDIPAAARDFVPHKLLLAPRISGVSVDAVFAALSGLIDDGVVDDGRPNPLQSRGSAILAKGPVSIGLDALAFDVGPATFAGTGAVRVSGAVSQDVTGTATIEAHGFNALVRRAGSDPLLRQAAPALIFLKGIGDEDDSGTVTWKITYGGGKFLVNGNDMSQMLPHK